MKKVHNSNPRRGRPPSFNRDEALEKAMYLFWKQGYATTSINDLTEALGVTPPSLYAAFGNKEALFEKAIELYAAGPGNAMAVIREGASARTTVEKLLKGSATELTKSGRPSGCMVIASAINGSALTVRVQELMRQRRSAIESGIRRCIQRDIDNGDLPDMSASALARFYYSVVEGMTIQARDGAGRKKLLEVVELAMLAWPQPEKSHPGESGKSVS